jgi:hypothetical protein
MDKDLARAKNLIIGDDDTRYKELENKYKLSVELLINYIINSTKIDDIIDESDSYIGISKQAGNKYKNKLLGSKYLYLDNKYYVEKLTDEDISVLLSKPSVDNDVIDIIKRTLKDVVTLGNSPKQIYGHPYPNKVIDNSSIIMVICLGKNKENNEDFRSLLKRQNALCTNISNQIKTKILDNLNINTEIIMEKLI